MMDEDSTLNKINEVFIKLLKENGVYLATETIVNKIFLP